jgi:hypothetical protein
MNTNMTYCLECDEVQRYRVERGTGLWFCVECGFAIDCVECGRTMFNGHDCAEIVAALS